MGPDRLMSHRVPARAAVIFVLGVVSARGVGVAAATERLVPSQYPTIQAAIDAAVDGDIVTVADGVYTGTGNRDIDFLGKELTVRSENGPANCIIDCEASWTDPHRGFYFHDSETAASVLEGVTIQNGYAPDEEGCGTTGGGILCRDSANPTIRNCLVRWCTAIDL
jgi:hypothetical protein